MHLRHDRYGSAPACDILTGILILLMIIPLPGIAQKKLKLLVDKNSGDSIFYTSEDRMYIKAGRAGAIAERLASTVYRSRNGLRLALSIETGRTNNFSISSGSVAEIKLQNGNVVVLEISTNNNAHSTARGYGSSVSAFYPLRKRDISDLKSSPVSSVRIQYSSGYMDFEISSEKFAAIIQKQLARIEKD